MEKAKMPAQRVLRSPPRNNTININNNTNNKNHNKNSNSNNTNMIIILCIPPTMQCNIGEDIFFGKGMGGITMIDSTVFCNVPNYL